MSIYKGNKLVAGGSVDTHFVRKPAWDRAVFVSVADLVAGYKAPADGMIVGLLYTRGTSTGVSIKVNGVEVARNKAIDSQHILNVQCLVSKDNVITITSDDEADIAETSTAISFVPFEDSAISESDIEVVTPELIRNLHDPDWSQAIPITATQLAEGYTVPKRGTIVGSIIPNTYDVTGSPIIKINGVVVAYARGSSNEITHGSVQCPVCANDIVRLEGLPKENCDSHISFVPYKAQ